MHFMKKKKNMYNKQMKCMHVVGATVQDKKKFKKNGHVFAKMSQTQIGEHETHMQTYPTFE